MKLSRVVLGSAIAGLLVGGGLMATPVAAQDECGVAIYGGDVFNETVIDLNANAGTAISDASAGSNNAATTGGGGFGDATSVTDIASAGNGGVATAAANGGAISTGDINSGGNVGNAISVGDTTCYPVYEDVKYEAEDKKAHEEAAVGAEVVALPDTGVGIGDASALFALISSAGAAAASLGLRRR
ncbi:MAG: hypothetical protein K0S99_2333 [Thermomicrobiales bacterium]|nr:hypothetical protein [Thermomicrobiales bacterium]